jgi:hypothetical protein
MWVHGFDEVKVEPGVFDPLTALIAAHGGDRDQDQGRVRQRP